MSVEVRDQHQVPLHSDLIWGTGSLIVPELISLAKLAGLWTSGNLPPWCWHCKRTTLHPAFPEGAWDLSSGSRACMLGSYYWAVSSTIYNYFKIICIKSTKVLNDERQICHLLHLDYSLSVDITELRPTVLFLLSIFSLVLCSSVLPFCLFWTEKSKSFWFSTFSFICSSLQFSLSSYGRDCNV